MILSLLFCQAVLIGQGYTAHDIYNLKPSAHDEYFWIAKKDHFSFAADLFEYESNGTIRLFIFDNKANYTAVSSGTVNHNGQVEVKQVIGYGTANPLTISLSCFKN